MNAVDVKITEEEDGPTKNEHNEYQGTVGELEKEVRNEYKQREREKERERDREIGRQADGQRGRERGRERDRERTKNSTITCKEKKYKGCIAMQHLGLEAKLISGAVKFVSLFIG